MEEKDYAREYGLRCKQIRQAKGLSQQALADLMHVTPQAVSKWEKDGIINVNTVMQLSNVLGQDITMDQIDQEGSVGEIGKEILQLLTKNDGYLDFADLEANLFGLSVERISNEIFKLERIGLVVREQYKDFLDQERDGVIITAKGLIVFKNIVGKDRLELIYADRTTTLEMRLNEGESSIQDIINNDRISQLLWKTDYYGAFRVDYLRYLKENYRNQFPQEKEEPFSDNVEELISGQSCFADLMFRMAKGVSDFEYEGEVIDCPDEAEEHRESLVYKSMSMDTNTVNAQMYLCKALEGLPDFDDVLANGENAYHDKDDKTAQMAVDDLEAWNAEEEYFKNYFSPLPLWESMSEQQKNNCARWFTKEEVLEYLSKNYSIDEDEKQKYWFSNAQGQRGHIDEVIREIWELDPSTLDYFYSFPDEWEENGLAQAVRDKFGVPARIKPEVKPEEVEKNIEDKTEEDDTE